MKFTSKLCITSGVKSEHNQFSFPLQPIVLSDVILSLGTFLPLSLSLIQWDPKGLIHYCIIILLFLWSPVKTAAPYLYKVIYKMNKVYFIQTIVN